MAIRPRDVGEETEIASEARDLTMRFGDFTAVDHVSFRIRRGNTFRHSRSVTKEPLAGDLQWGGVMTWGGVRLSYTHVVRTREFKAQAGSDQFGAFSLSISF